jgi:membrane-associated phospholipid phosphatase
VLGVVVLASCVLAWRRVGPRWMAFLIVSYAGVEVLFWALKVVVDRPRPPTSLQLATVASSSYPSGHTAVATAVSASLFILEWRTSRLLLRRTALVALVALPLVVGFSRLALGVHWLTDVLGGLLLGVGWVLLCAALVLRDADLGERWAPGSAGGPPIAKESPPHPRPGGSR